MSLPLGLLNTSIMTTDGTYSLKTITLEDAKKLIAQNCEDILSAIGHQSTAEIMSALLEIEVQNNRIQFKQQVGQDALVFKLRGRPPEGKILTIEEMHEIGFDFQLMTRID